MPSSSRKFKGLLTEAPKPLPDDDESQPTELTGAEKPEPAAAEPVSTPGAAAVAAPKPGGERGGRASRPRSVRAVPDAGTQPSSSAVPAGEARAATTIRLHQPAAAALNSAWLDQRMHVNPKLSYPEFASEIVRLGLAAFKRQAERS
jgi:hypothetical protein